jgi:nucleotide-binding universal stress UspA family protein
MKVLIGFDGSDSSRDAIRDLHRAGLPPDTDATVVSAADVWPRLPAESFEPAGNASAWQQSPIVRKARTLAEQAIAEVRALAAEGGALVKAEFPGWTVSDASYSGAPADVLIGAEGAPDLVVVGSQGKSALGRLVLGSVSQKVLMHAPCSVRVGRRPPADAAPRGGAVRIVIGIDGSRHSALAVSAVAGRVWPSGTQVKVVAALNLQFLAALAGPGAATAWAAPWMAAPPSGDDARTWACDAVEAVAAELCATGLVTTTVVQEADPKTLLLQEAEQWSADCIFVGAKGHGAVARFLLGSVSASVAARASCSVELVRQG